MNWESALEAMRAGKAVRLPEFMRGVVLRIAENGTDVNAHIKLVMRSGRVPLDTVQPFYKAPYKHREDFAEVP
jgi:hypothetical protein